MTRILLVEDSKFLRIATQRALSRAGYAVTTAVDGEEALRMVHECAPDLVLLDMLIPKVSGHDVLKAIKHDASTARVPVVALSGLSQKNAQRLEADGASAYLEKSQLELDKDCGPLLTAVKEIVERLRLAQPASEYAKVEAEVTGKA